MSERYRAQRTRNGWSVVATEGRNLEVHRKVPAAARISHQRPLKYLESFLPELNLRSIYALTCNLASYFRSHASQAGGVLTYLLLAGGPLSLGHYPLFPGPPASTLTANVVCLMSPIIWAYLPFLEPSLRSGYNTQLQ